MAFIPVANTVMAEFIYLWDNQVCENTAHFEKAAGWDVTSMNDLADILQTWWSTYYDICTTTDLFLTSIKLTDLTTQNAMSVEHVVSPQIPGTYGETACPANVAVCCTLLTPNRGRSFRGRWYAPGIPSGQVTNNVISTQLHDNLYTAMQELIDAAIANTTPLVIASRYSNNSPRATGVTTEVIDARVNTTVDSQRRRLPGRGR